MLRGKHRGDNKSRTVEETTEIDQKNLRSENRVICLVTESTEYEKNKSPQRH